MTDVETAVERGCAFLVAAQDPQGLWHDSELEGEGSDFVTAYVARCLWAVLSMPGREGLQHAFDAACQGLSRRQRRNGGWAYSAATATDAEVTAWALLCLLDQRDRRGFSTARARTYLDAHWDPESGGYRPYLPPVDDEGGRPDFRAPEVLRRVDPYVTGAVVRALVTSGGTGRAIEAACRYLRRVQDDDGLWTSPLWTSRGAPTYLALSALDMTGSMDEQTREKARDGIGKLLTEASGYELAAALVCAPRLDPAEAPVDAAIERLLAEQDEDGAWTSPVRIRAVGPVPKRADDEGVEPDVRYRGRLLTTVTAVTGLYFSAGAGGGEAYRAYLAQVSRTMPADRSATA